MIKKIEKSGVVAMSPKGYWGVQHEDGQSRSEGFGPIENATVSDPRYCTKPTNMTWNPANTNGHNPYYDQLRSAVLVPIKITTTYEAAAPEGQERKP
jgi:hypothetical protein